MKKGDFNQGITFKVYPQKHLRADGFNTLYLRVTIDRKKKEFNLKEQWPEFFFDMVKQEVKPRHVNDTDMSRVNMVIGEAKGRANRIKMRYFSDSKMLTLELFAREFEHYESRENFLYYWKQKQEHNLNEGIITLKTAKNHTTNYNRIVEFLGGVEHLPFDAVTTEWVKKYNRWMREKRKPTTLKHNSACTAHTRLRTYILAAIADGYRTTNPYEKFPINYQDGEREALDQQELAALRALLADNKLSDNTREVLRKFLFSCYTGLRISDSAQVHHSMIKNGKIKLSLIKGSVYYGKEVSIMLPKYALELIEGRKGFLFKQISDQKCNGWLKVIQEAASIDKTLTFHVSRDTFGTLFIQLGGDVVTLSKLMGHSDIRTTMIYVKMSENRKDLLMANFNNL
jgi:site-specific recombinase XerD